MDQPWDAPRVDASGEHGTPGGPNPLHASKYPVGIHGECWLQFAESGSPNCDHKGMAIVAESGGMGEFRVLPVDEDSHPDDLDGRWAAGVHTSSRPILAIDGAFCIQFAEAGSPPPDRSTWLTLPEIGGEGEFRLICLDGSTL